MAERRAEPASTAKQEAAPLGVDRAALADEIDRRIRELPERGAEPARRVRRAYSERLRAAPAGSVLELALALVGRQRWVAYELLAHHPCGLARLGADDIERLGQGMADWGAVDAFGCILAGPAWRQGRIPDEAVRRWAASPDRWWRRAALVSTVALNVRARGGTGDVARTLDICERLVADPDDMVVKALSWALRELVVWDPGAVRGFLAAHDGVLASRVRREVRAKLETGRKHGPGPKLPSPGQPGLDGAMPTDRPPDLPARLLLTERDALLPILRRTPAAAFDLPTDCAGWSVRDVLAHCGAALTRVAEHRLHAFTPQDNQLDVAERRPWPLSSVLDELERGYGRAAPLLTAAGGKLDGIALGEWVHGGDVREALGEPHAYCSEGVADALVLVAERSRRRGLPATLVRLPDQELRLGVEEPQGTPAELVTDPATLIRLCSGRPVDPGAFTLTGADPGRYLLFR